MIRVDCEQGTQEWTEARLGIATASEFDRIVTSKGKPSAQADKYLCEKAAEALLGHPVKDFLGNEWTTRGTEMEAEAVRWYEFDRDVTCERVGFCLRDDRSAGCSPDRLVGTDGMAQIKCPSAAQHVAYLLGWGKDGGDYKVQVQGELWVCERQWSDLISYHPSLPRACVRVERDEEFIEMLAKAVATFNGKLRAALGQLREFVEVA